MKTSRVFELGGRKIGPGHPAYLIAEAGVNHNGNTALARDLIHAAKRAGADCVKFQTFKADNLVTAAAPKAAYQLQTTDPAESQREMLRKLELPFEAYQELIQICKKEGIQFLSTPYSVEDVDFLMKLGVDGFKVASGQIAEPYFLEYVAKTGLPLVVSTGMATIAEIGVAVDTIRKAGNENFCLLQCTTNYPSLPKDANLLAMNNLAAAFNVVAGYSDHVPSNNCAIASVALGASLLEKHFTIDTKMDGPDHSCSLDEAGFKDFVAAVREVEIALGDGMKKPTEIELKNAKGMRRSIVAKRAIKAGELLSTDNLTFKRPATGMPPVDLAKVVGRPAACDLAPDTMLTPGHIQW